MVVAMVAMEEVMVVAAGLNCGGQTIVGQRLIPFGFMYVTFRKGGFIQLICGKQIPRLNPPLQSITNYRIDTRHSFTQLVEAVMHLAVHRTKNKAQLSFRQR
jgi:hypothetical protein